jgi:hypothetical protein
MILSSPSILSFVFSVVMKLTGEFTSLDEPTDDSDIAIIVVFLSTDPISSYLKGESTPRNRRENSDFRLSGPSPDLSLQRPE